MASLKLIIFDFDGTLADSFQCFCECLNICAQKFSFKAISDSDIPALRQMSSHEIIQRLQIPWWKQGLIARHMRRLMAERITEIQLFPDVPQALKELRAMGLELVLVTSNSKSNVRKILGPEVFDLFARGEFGVGLMGKKSRLKKVIRHFKLSATQAIYVGDEQRDAEAARALGMPFGAVGWGYTTLEKLKDSAPEHLFLEVKEIPRAFQPSKADFNQSVS